MRTPSRRRGSPVNTASWAREHPPGGSPGCPAVWLQSQSIVHSPLESACRFRTSVGAHLELLGTLHLVLDPPAEERVAHDVAVLFTKAAGRAQRAHQLVLIGG